MGVEGKVSYPYFISKFRDPRAKGGNVFLDMLDLGAAWVII